MSGKIKAELFSRLMTVLSLYSPSALFRFSVSFKTHDTALHRQPAAAPRVNTSTLPVIVMAESKSMVLMLKERGARELCVLKIRL